MPKSLRNSQGGCAQIVVLLILLVGVGLGIYLVQHPQIFRPKASVSSPVSGPISDTYDADSDGLLIKLKVLLGQILLKIVL